MNLQYISDSKGETTGVFIPIRDWEELKSKYKGIEQEDIEIPEWQKDIVRERLEDYRKNPDKTLDWEKIKNDFNLD
jgi:putative addiction module component